MTKLNLNERFAALKFLAFVGWVAITIALTIMVVRNATATKALTVIGQHWPTILLFVALVAFVTAWVMERPGKGSLAAALVLLVFALVFAISNWSVASKWFGQFGWLLLGTIAYLVATMALGAWITTTKKTNQPTNP